MFNDLFPGYSLDLEGNLYNTETFKWVSKQEGEWLESMFKLWITTKPFYSEWQWGEIFKDSPGPAIQGLRQRIKETTAAITQANEKKRELKKQLSDFKDRWWLDTCTSQIDAEIKAARSEIRAWNQLIAKLSRRKDQQEQTSSEITDEDIKRAKEVPMQNLIDGQFHTNGINLVGRCPFHTEKHPSFTIFGKSNSWYCFGQCAEGGDTISYMMKKTGGSFLDTVKFLINK